MRSQIVKYSSLLFHYLEKPTLFNILSKLRKNLRHNDQFIDIYVILHSILAFVVSIVCVSIHSSLRTVLFIYAVWRLYEMMVFLVNTLLFNDYRAVLKGKRARPFGGIRRLIILLAFNFIEVLFWFAFFYRGSIHELNVPSIDAWLSSISFSLVTMSSFGNSSITATNACAIVETTAQAIIGLFIFIIMIARLVSVMPSVGTRDIIERKLQE